MDLTPLEPADHAGATRLPGPTEAHGENERCRSTIEPGDIGRPVGNDRPNRGGLQQACGVPAATRKYPLMGRPKSGLTSLGKSVPSSEPIAANVHRRTALPSGEFSPQPPHVVYEWESKTRSRGRDRALDLQPWDFFESSRYRAMASVRLGTPSFFRILLLCT